MLDRSSIAGAKVIAGSALLPKTHRCWNFQCTTYENFQMSPWGRLEVRPCDLKLYMYMYTVHRTTRQGRYLYSVLGEVMYLIGYEWKVWRSFKSVVIDYRSPRIRLPLIPTDVRMAHKLGVWEGLHGLMLGIGFSEHHLHITFTRGAMFRLR